MSEKTCNTCEVSKSLEEYTNNKRNKDGKDNRCKVCESERRKQNRDKLRESQKKIEKGKGYTDDMSDALAGALWMCSQDKFYKQNNEAIATIIERSGQISTTQSTKSMRGLASKINNRSPFRRSDLGFRYGR